MKTILIILLSLSFLNVFSQVNKTEIQNVDAQVVNDKIEISFDIVNAQLAQKFKVSVMIKLGSKDLTPRTLSGDTGFISAGHKIIIWDVLKDQDELEGAIIPTVTIIKTIGQIREVSRSAFVPGFNNGNKLLATLSYASLIGGGIMYFQSKSIYENYKKENEDPVTRADFYKKSNNTKMFSLIFIGAGAGLLASNILLVKIYNKKHQLAFIDIGSEGICMKYIHRF